MQYSSAIKKNEILTFGTKWVKLENIMLNEYSQIEKQAQHILFYSYEFKKSTQK